MKRQYLATISGESAPDIAGSGAKANTANSITPLIKLTNGLARSKLKCNILLSAKNFFV